MEKFKRYFKVGGALVLSYLLVMLLQPVFFIGPTPEIRPDGLYYAKLRLDYMWEKNIASLLPSSQKTTIRVRDETAQGPSSAQIQSDLGKLQNAAFSEV